MKIINKISDFINKKKTTVLIISLIFFLAIIYVEYVLNGISDQINEFYTSYFDNNSDGRFLYVFLAELAGVGPDRYIQVSSFGYSFVKLGQIFSLLGITICAISFCKRSKGGSIFKILGYIYTLIFIMHTVFFTIAYMKDIANIESVIFFIITIFALMYYLILTTISVIDLILICFNKQEEDMETLSDNLPKILIGIISIFLYQLCPKDFYNTSDSNIYQIIINDIYYIIYLILFIASFIFYCLLKNKNLKNIIGSLSFSSLYFLIFVVSIIIPFNSQKMIVFSNVSTHYEVFNFYTIYVFIARIRYLISIIFLIIYIVFIIKSISNNTVKKKSKTFKRF